MTAAEARWTAEPGRLERLRSSVDADSSRGWWLFTMQSDVRWLTGFEGSFGSVLVEMAGGGAALITDPRYAEKARGLLRTSRLPCEVVTVDGRRKLADAVVGVVGSDPIRIDPAQVTHAQFTALATVPGGIIEAPSPLTDLRRMKDDAEIMAIRRAAAITDDALRSVVEDGLAGRSERSIATRIEFLMREHGAEAVAFDPIVARGPNASVPHHVPGEDVVATDDLVIIDVGARVDGYRSDMTRTVVVGSPDAERMRMLEVTTVAQSAGVGAVSEGADCASVDSACRAVFEAHGVADLFIHGVGHGVGLDIHEEPFLTSASGTILRRGEVVTVEPGLYREGLGGARVEDSVLVTATGAEILTQTPKDIRCPRSRRTI